MVRPCCELKIKNRSRYTEIEEDGRDPYSDCADSEILTELPVLAGLTDAKSDEDESEEDQEGKHSEQKTNSVTNHSLPRARMKILYHCPAQFVPTVKLCNIAGNAAVTVYQRFDSKRRLMTIGTWYLEGFIES